MLLKNGKKRVIFHRLQVCPPSRPRYYVVNSHPLAYMNQVHVYVEYV